MLPDLVSVKARLEGYPERMEVELSQREGGRPITLTGIHDPDEVFYVRYDDHENIHGTLMFERDYKGKVLYSQYLMWIGHPPPQSWIDATWPVMRQIEQDLAQEFDLPELRGSVHIDVSGVEDPDRPMPEKACECSRGSRP